MNEDSSEMLFWEYSAHTLALMADYMTRFPVMFQNLQSLPHQKRYAAKDVVGGAKPADTKDILESIAAWMSLQTYHNLPRTPFTTDALSRYRCVCSVDVCRLYGDVIVCVIERQ